MKKDKSTLITVAIILVIIVGVGVYTFKSVDEAKREAADFTSIQGNDGETPYTDLEGNPADLSEYEGRVLVVNAWASWCPFCVQELPDFGRLQEEFDGQIEVIAINRKESAPTAEAFIKHVGNPGSIDFLLDSKDAFYKSIGGFSMPETVFYDEEGNISFHKRGSMGLEEMRLHTENAIAGSNK